MNEKLEPRHYSDRELTLSGISVTFQRARLVQRELTGRSSWPQPDTEVGIIDGADDADLADGTGGRDNGNHAALALEENDEAELPNPFVTDANLRYYLDQATTHQGRPGLLATAKALLRGDQARYNTAIVHALHQLDHRTRYQQRTITRLEAELASARRALAALDPFEP